MNADQLVRSISGRLSLRDPQAESLHRLAAALDGIPALRDHRARSPEELTTMMKALGIQCPTF